MGKWPLVASAAGGLFLADQLSKLAVWHWLAPVRQVRIIPGCFDLSFVMNTGVAFGLMAGGRGLVRVAVLTGASLLALGIIAVFIVKARPEERLLLWGLALVSGGAVGNVVDRLRLGAVTDFLDFYLSGYHWPAFNLADAGITIGTVLILIHLWRIR